MGKQATFALQSAVWEINNPSLANFLELSEKLHMFFGVSNSVMRMGDENSSMAVLLLLNNV